MVAGRFVVDGSRRFTEDVRSNDPAAIVVRFGSTRFVRRGFHDHNRVGCSVDNFGDFHGARGQHNAKFVVGERPAVGCRGTVL